MKTWNDDNMLKRLDEDWKNTYDKYVVAANKPKTYDDRYKNLKKKYDDLNQQANRKISDTLNILSTENVKFENGILYFYIDGKQVRDTSLFNLSSILKAAHISLDVLKNVLSCIFCQELGTCAMNQSKSEDTYINNYHYDTDRTLTLPQLALLVNECQGIVNNVTEDFRTKLLAAEEDANKDFDKVSAFEKAKYNRERAPYELQNQTIRDWWNEEALKPGTKLAIGSKKGGWSHDIRIVDHVKADGTNNPLIYFTDGSKTRAETIDRRRSFDLNNEDPNAEGWDKSLFRTRY